MRIDGEVPGAPYYRAKCTFCAGENTVAMWMGCEGKVFTCYDCAVTILPRLLADALVGRHRGKQSLREVNECAKATHGEFWRALYLATIQGPGETRS